MNNEASIHESFCHTYADAVVRFIVTGINEDVSFDTKKQRFVSKPVDDDVPPSSCDWWVGRDWPTFVGTVPCATDLADSKFKEQLLRNAIIYALKKSATGKRMSRILADLD